MISEEKYLSGLRKAGLEKVKVCERLEYQLAELESIIKLSYGIFLFPDSGDEKKPEVNKTTRLIAKELEGKIASVMISACKPAF